MKPRGTAQLRAWVKPADLDRVSRLAHDNKLTYGAVIHRLLCLASDADVSRVDRRQVALPFGRQKQP